MSAFRRRQTPATALPPGYRPSHFTTHPQTSTGIRSLDDLFGGGIPLGSTVLVSEGSDTSYSRLLWKYYVAQGILSGQTIVLVGANDEDQGGIAQVVNKLMAVVGNQDQAFPVHASTVAEHNADKNDDDDSEEEDDDEVKEKMTIAWRYEELGKHKLGITQQEPQTSTSQQGLYQYAFDLSKTLQLTPKQKSQIHTIVVDEHMSDTKKPLVPALETIFDKIKVIATKSSSIGLRVAVLSLGSAAYPPCTISELFTFCTRLGSLLKSSPQATQPAHTLSGLGTAMLTFPRPIYSEAAFKKLQWATDACIVLEPFGNDAILRNAFPHHQGLVKLPRLAHPGALGPPVTKVAALLGGGEGSTMGESSNLGFKVGRRKGMKIELMGLGVEDESRDVKEETTTAPRADVDDKRQLQQAEVASKSEVQIKKPRVKPRARVRFGEDGDGDGDGHSHKDLGDTSW